MSMVKVSAKSSGAQEVFEPCHSGHRSVDQLLEVRQFVLNSVGKLVVPSLEQRKITLQLGHLDNEPMLVISCTNVK